MITSTKAWPDLSCVVITLVIVGSFGSLSNIISLRLKSNKD